MSTRIFLTTASVSPWTVPSDWNSASNSIEVIGGGGGGANNTGLVGGGGAGGGYSKIVNLSLTGGSTVAFAVGSGGPGGSANGTAGGDTWFDGTGIGDALVMAKGGPPANGGTGGAKPALGTGTTRFQGGKGGNYLSGPGGAGGGGAAGLNGDGNPGNNSSGGVPAGGSGDAGFGGSGGTGMSGGGGTGGPGTEYDASHGSGGGGGGGTNAGGTGGFYGGGGGGGQSSSGGGGRDGLIIITYDPVGQQAAGWNINTDIPAQFAKNFTDPRSGFSNWVPFLPPQQPWGWIPQIEYRYAKTLPVHLQPWLGFFSSSNIPTAATPQGWQGDFGWQFKAQIPVTEQQFSKVDLKQPASATAWFWGLSGVNLAYLPLEPTQIDFSFIPYPLQPTGATPQGWQGSFEPRFATPLSPALQQFISTRIDQPPSHLSVVWGYAAMDEVLLPLEVCYQPFSDVPLNLPPTGATPQGWQGDFGYEFAKPFPAVQQSYIGFTPQGQIPTAATPQGWVGNIGTVFVKPLPVSEQPYIGFTPQGSIPTKTQFGWNVTPAYAFSKPLSPTQQQFVAFRTDLPPTGATPQGWFGSFEYKFAKPFPIVLQQWPGFFTPGSVPTAVTRQGWWGFQPEIFAKQFPVTQQQYSAFQPRGIITVQAPPVIDPYIYPGDKKAKKERKRILDEALPLSQIFDPRKLSRKQRKLLAELEAKRWETLTEGPTREQKLHEDMQRAIQEVLEKAEKKRIEDAKVSGLFAAPPSIGLEASLHATIRVVKELERQHELDEARKALRRAQQEAIERQARSVEEAQENARRAKLAALKAKKAEEDAKLLARYRMKKKRETQAVYDAVTDSLKPSRLRQSEHLSILDEVFDIAKRKK